MTQAQTVAIANRLVKELARFVNIAGKLALENIELRRKLKRYEAQRRR